MAQLDIGALVKKIHEAEIALPGFCDKAIAAITAAEGGMIGDFILHHLGIADPKAAEEEVVAGLRFVKSAVAQGGGFIEPFLSLLLSLQPAKAA